MALIFIAVPTKGVAANGKLYEHFPRDVARLHELYPQHTFLVPMIQDYALLPHMQVDANWETWGHHCRVLIKVSDEVWVIMYDGWGESVGVTAELDLAVNLGKPITIIHPTMINGAFVQ